MSDLLIIVFLGGLVIGALIYAICQSRREYKEWRKLFKP